MTPAIAILAFVLAVTALLVTLLRPPVVFVVPCCCEPPQAFDRPMILASA